MPTLPAPGTFRLYPFAEPPVPAGEYVLTGDVSGLPGGVEQLRAAVHITAPRYTMPPDQILFDVPARRVPRRVRHPAAAGRAAPPDPALGAVA